MSLAKSVEDLTLLAGIARVAFPGNTAKLLARLMGVEVATAKFWLARNFSAARMREAAARLLVELDRQDAEERAEARRLLLEIVGDSFVVGSHRRLAREAEPELAAGAALGAEAG